MWQRRVLVEQRVVEDAAGAADGRARRRPAPPRRGTPPARRWRMSASISSRPDSARTSTIRPSSNRSSSPRTVVPPSDSGIVERTVPCVRRQSGAVKTSSVGRFGTISMPPFVVVPAAPQLAAAGSARPRGRCPGRGSGSASSASSVQRRRPGGQLRAVLAPGRDRVGLRRGASSRRRGPTAPSTSGVPSTRSAQAGVGQAPITQLSSPETTFGMYRSRSSNGSVAATRAGSSSSNSPGEASPARSTPRRARVPAVDPASRCSRRARQLRRPELDQRPPHVRVAVPGRDATRARAVGGPRHRPHRVGVLRRGQDHDLLARLHVGTDADEQLGVALQAVIHGGQDRQLRPAPARAGARRGSQSGAPRSRGSPGGAPAPSRRGVPSPNGASGRACGAERSG